MQAQQGRSRPLAVLDPFIGQWEMSASVGGVTLTGGRATFDWLEDGWFMVQRADAEPTDDTPPEFVANSPFPTVCVIGLDDSSGEFSLLYADARGVRRVYRMSFDGRVWKQWRDAPGFFQRLEATFSDDGATIAGRWEKSPDGSDWELDFEFAYGRS